LPSVILVHASEQECIPAEKLFHEQQEALPSRWMIPPVVEDLKKRARQLVRVRGQPVGMDDDQASRVRVCVCM
jgi:hypothetical protein